MKTYTFKHPVTREWVNIVAESFRAALNKLRRMV